MILNVHSWKIRRLSHIILDIIQAEAVNGTFVNVFLWARFYNVTYAVIEDTLVFKSEDEGRLAFAYPAGEATV